MGVNTNAYLFYGLVFDDEGPIWKIPSEAESDLDGDSDWETVLDYRLGTRGQDYAARSAARDALGVTIIRHCSGSCPMYAVAITGSKATAYRGHPVRVLTVASGADWNSRLLAFCKLMHIDPRGNKSKGPDWFVASYWSE